MNRFRPAGKLPHRLTLVAGIAAAVSASPKIDKEPFGRSAVSSYDLQGRVLSDAEMAEHVRPVYKNLHPRVRSRLLHDLAEVDRRMEGAEEQL